MMNKRIALVTGGSRRMGREIALHLAKGGAGVAVHYFRHKTDAEKIVGEIRKKGGMSAAFGADLTEEKQAGGLIRKVEREFGRLDILVNNFGPFLQKPWEKVTRKEWISTLEGNLMSAFYCMKAALPGLRKRRWGRVINIGYSRAEHLAAFPNILPYAVAKTGLLLMTRTAAVSEAEYGITVNMVSPGLIKGGVMPSVKSLPESRLGEFKDVAEAVAFLVSEGAGRITGTNLVVAGTWKM